MPQVPSIPGPGSAFRKFSHPCDVAPACPRTPMDGCKGRSSVCAAATTRLKAVYSEMDVLPDHLRKCLTTPSEGVGNGGADNERNDLVVHVGDIFEDDAGDSELIANGIGGRGVADSGAAMGTETAAGATTERGAAARRGYEVRDALGAGTFGQVFQCFHFTTGEQVAVKVVKNQEQYFHQACVEISILRDLENWRTEEVKRCVVEFKRHFVFKGHMCLVFEELSSTLLKVLRRDARSGIWMHDLRSFLSQLLRALVMLEQAQVVHCDIKPENILLTGAKHKGEIKLIDFGSACQVHYQHSSYVQSRFYRSPEILLGAQQYDCKIDMWSLGCVVAELLLGFPLFPGKSQEDMLARVEKMVGPFPPEMSLNSRGTDTSPDVAVEHDHDLHLESSSGIDAERNALPRERRRYFPQPQLHETIMAAGPKTPSASKAAFVADSAANSAAAKPGDANLEAAASRAAANATKALTKELPIRESLFDLIRGMLRIDPRERWSPAEVAAHPFMQDLPLPGGIPWHPQGRNHAEESLARGNASPAQVETHASPGITEAALLREEP